MTSGISSPMIPKIGFSFSECTLLFFFFMFCYIEVFLKRRFYVIIRGSVVNCTAVVIMTYFYKKIKLYGLCVNYFVSERPVPFTNMKV